MSVRVRLDVVLARRRMSMAELADRVGILPDHLDLLRKGRARALRLSTLDALCRELDCQPGDLLDYDPSPLNVADPSDGGPQGS